MLKYFSWMLPGTRIGLRETVRVSIESANRVEYEPRELHSVVLEMDHY